MAEKKSKQTEETVEETVDETPAAEEKPKRPRAKKDDAAPESAAAADEKPKRTRAKKAEPIAAEVAAPEAAADEVPREPDAQGAAAPVAVEVTSVAEA